MKMLKIEPVGMFEICLDLGVMSLHSLQGIPLISTYAFAANRKERDRERKIERQREMWREREICIYIYIIYI